MNQRKSEPNIHSPDTVDLIPLGGMGEIGKNLCIWETEDDAIVVDAGLAFPEEEMLGIDIVIPELEYLFSIRDKVSAIIVTHGHEDHIGSLPYVLQQMTVPVYGPGLAIGLARQKLEEFDLSLPAGSKMVKPREHIVTDRFDVGFFRVSHSIADAMGLAIRTPAGLMVHSGDFKFDQTPVNGEITDFYTLSQLGDEGVRCLICDSTNAERPGVTGSERLVGEHLREIFRTAQGRILFTTFASNIPRLQQVIEIAAQYNRKVSVVGRSMRNSLEVSQEMGYVDIPDGIIVDLNQMKNLPDDQTAILVTGSQGEPMSALTLMSQERDRRMNIQPGDTVVIAANPVPGNEKLVYRTVDNLSRLGAHVVYGSDSGVHVSGHASREEIKLMLNLTQPDNVIPVHGEYRHMKAFEELAKSMDYSNDSIFLLENGQRLRFDASSARRAGSVDAGQVLVDGLGVGDVGNVVLRDRERLSEHGIVMVVLCIDGDTGNIVAGPEIITRGFVYVRESEELLNFAQNKVKEAVSPALRRGVTQRGQLKDVIRDSLHSYLYESLQRRPMILPIIMDVSS